MCNASACRGIRSVLCFAPGPRVEMPKPDGGVRKPGIPTVLDRFIQQAVMQVLQRKWDGTFSEHSYGFRPGRSAHQAVEKARRYIAEGFRRVVDLDLEKFFDRVNHDKLMAKIAARVNDKRMLKLIRAFLTAGVMEDGLVKPVDRARRKAGHYRPCCRTSCSMIWIWSWSSAGYGLRGTRTIVISTFAASGPGNG
jgi:RNA-directed DNA polymerase